MISFPAYFLIEFRRFFIDQVSGFPSCFFIEFRRFFHQFNIRFPPQFLTKFRKFSLSKPWSQTLTHLLEFASKRQGNYNIIKLHDQSRDRSNLIKTILYHNSSRGWLSHLLPDLSNLLNQLFESTYAINFFMTSVALRTCSTLLFQISVYT